jgi:hypothetical protein
VPREVREDCARAAWFSIICDGNFMRGEKGDKKEIWGTRVQVKKIKKKQDPKSPITCLYYK